MRLSVLLLSILLTAASCGHHSKKPAINSDTIYQTFETNFFDHYPDYQKRNHLKNPIDFIENYALSCGVDSCVNGTDYMVLQANEIYKAANNTYQSTFYYELIRFRNAARMNNLIAQLKDKYCIADPAIRLYNIYQVDTACVVAINYSNFTVGNYDSFMKFEFGNDMKTHVLSLSK